MKRHYKTILSRSIAMLLCVLMVLGCAVSAAADTAPLATSYDEAYYATLDYYGGLDHGSIVKTYRMNGNSAITDYGVYDTVNNLTDDAAPSLTDGKVAFSFDTAPDTFYFEGVTAQPYNEMPWSISLSYQLNGAPVLAENLPGKTGLIEIDLDLVPNAKASDYMKHNYVLMATTAFNNSDITSVAAPGAMVQLVGNLRTVIFAALPGEEQHYSICVGSEDFSFDGMIFMLMPATLEQMNQISDLRETKQDMEDSYNDISDSLDNILDNLDGLSGSLNGTADSLEGLSKATGNIFASHDALSSSATGAINSLDSLSGALTPLTGDLSTASKALTDITTQMTALTDTAVSMKTQLSQTRAHITALQTDLENLQGLLDDVEDDTKNLGDTLDELDKDLGDLQDDLKDLSDSTANLRAAMGQLKGVSTVSPITVGDMSTSDLRKQLKLLEGLSQIAAAHDKYEGYLAVNKLTEEQVPFAAFLVGAGESESNAADYAETWETYGDAWVDSYEAVWNTYKSAYQSGTLESQLQEVDTMNTLVGNMNQSIKDANTMIAAIAAKTSPLLADVGTLTDTLGADGVTEHLQDLTIMLSNIVSDYDKSDFMPSDVIDDLDAMGATVSDLTKTLDSVLTALKTLDDTLNGYVPDAQKTLSDLSTTVSATVGAIGSTQIFLRQLQNTIDANSDALDSSTTGALNSLADSLRKTGNSLDSTDDLRSAKDRLQDDIDDTWDEHTGEYDNLLLADPNAACESLTDRRNGAPDSVQFVMRTQEIKVDDDAIAAAKEASTDNGTFISRVMAMFRDIWSAITGLFR